jgi:GT2 family glycosyltransferase
LQKNKLGILVPNYNGASFIDETIDSLKKCFPKAKLIIVDDCSTDDSLKVLNELNVFVIKRERNGGFGAAVNSGLKYFQSKGYRNILIANSDIKLKKSDSILIISAINQFSNNSKMAVMGFVENNNEVMFNEELPGFLFVLKLNILDTVGYFDEKFYMYGEEQDFFRRVKSAGFNLFQSGIHVEHTGEMSGSNRFINSWYAIRNSIYLEVKTFSIMKVFYKITSLFFIINKFYSPKKIDLSIIRLRRQGILIGNIFLITAIIWNFYNLFFMLIFHVKSKLS